MRVLGGVAKSGVIEVHRLACDKHYHMQACIEHGNSNGVSWVASCPYKEGVGISEELSSGVGIESSGVWERSQRGRC